MVLFILLWINRNEISRIIIHFTLLFKMKAKVFYPNFYQCISIHLLQRDIIRYSRCKNSLMFLRLIQPECSMLHTSLLKMLLFYGMVVPSNLKKIISSKQIPFKEFQRNINKISDTVVLILILQFSTFEFQTSRQALYIRYP